MIVPGPLLCSLLQMWHKLAWFNGRRKKKAAVKSRMDNIHTLLHSPNTAVLYAHMIINNDADATPAAMRVVRDKMMCCHHWDIVKQAASNGHQMAIAALAAIPELPAPPAAADSEMNSDSKMAE